MLKDITSRKCVWVISMFLFWIGIILAEQQNIERNTILIDYSGYNNKIYCLSDNLSEVKTIADDISWIVPNISGMSFYRTRSGNCFVGDILSPRESHRLVVLEGLDINYAVASNSGDMFLTIENDRDLVLYTLSNNVFKETNIRTDTECGPTQPSWAPNDSAIAFYSYEKSDTNDREGFRLALVHIENEPNPRKETLTQPSFPTNNSGVRRKPPIWSSDSRLIFHEFRETEQQDPSNRTYQFSYNLVSKQNVPDLFYQYYSDDVKLSIRNRIMKWDVSGNFVETPIPKRTNKVAMLTNPGIYLRCDDYGRITIGGGDAEVTLLSLNVIPYFHLIRNGPRGRTNL
jgi:hypothetical protein